MEQYTTLLIIKHTRINMIPIYELRGADKNLPKKKVANTVPGIWQEKYDGINEAITQTEKCGLVVDEEKLAKLILEGLLDENYPRTFRDQANDVAKSLSATMKEWLIICPADKKGK